MDNFCLYCFSQSDITRMHLFPQVIGGRWSDYWCCAKCNSLIGQGVEGEIKKHLFFAYAIAKTELAKLDVAFEQIRITERESGERVKYVDGRLMGTARPRTQSRRIAPPKDMRRLIIKDIKKRYPKELDRYKNEYDSGQRIIRVGNEEHVFLEESKRATMEFQGKGGIPVSLLAKIAYESVWVFGQFGRDTLQRFYKDTFRVMQDSLGHVVRVECDNSLGMRVYCLQPNIRDGTTELDTVTFKRFHRLDFRVSERNIAYVRIEFFGVLPYIVAIGNIRRQDALNADYLDTAYFFPIDENTIHLEKYPEEYAGTIARNDALASLIWHRWNSRNSKGQKEEDVSHQP